MANLGQLTADLGVDIGELATAERVFNRFGQKIAQRATKIGKSLSLKLTVPILGFATLAGKAAIDFESAFTGVRKTVDATEKEFAALEKGLKKLSTEIPIATTELFGVAEAAGQLGIETDSILSFTRVMADLGATTNLTAQEAATSLARLANITGLAADDYDRLGSTIVDLGNNLATTEAEIVEMGLRLAGAGKTIGLTEDQILSFAGALSSVGIRAEAGGTAFSRVFKDIASVIGTNSDVLTKFAEISGKSVEDFEQQWKENAAGAILDFIEGLGQLQKEGKNINVLLDELGFGNIRVSDALLRAAGSGDLFRKALELGSKAWEQNTALTKEAELRYKTSQSKIVLFKNRIVQLAASFGELLIPVLLKVVDFLEPVIQFFRELSPEAKTAIIVMGVLAAALGPLLIAFGLFVSALGSIIAIPFIGTISAIIAVVGLLATAAILLVKNWESVKTFFIDFWNGLVALVDETITALRGKINEFVDIGRAIVRGIIKGISETVRFLVDAAVNAARSALKAAKDFLGISSPSSVFAEIGQQMMAGMAQGITASMNMPQVALTGVPLIPSGQSNNTDNRTFNNTFNMGAQEDEFTQRQGLQRLLDKNRNRVSI